MPELLVWPLADAVLVEPLVLPAGVEDFQGKIRLVEAHPVLLVFCEIPAGKPQQGFFLLRPLHGFFPGGFPEFPGAFLVLVGDLQERWLSQNSQLRFPGSDPWEEGREKD